MEFCFISHVENTNAVVELHSLVVVFTQFGSVAFASLPREVVHGHRAAGFVKSCVLKARGEKRVGAGSSPVLAMPGDVINYIGIVW
uniref:Uncharacterized protein n=1 Tax=Rhipicephalus appendiculatus TaxID=34631 RepID=A0A131YBT7_RHIAP